MYEANYSEVSEFVFFGLSSYRPIQHFLLASSSILYVSIVPGNLVVFTVTFAPPLHTPMYFFLANLSFIDLRFSPLSVSKMISDLYFRHKTISFQECILQMFVLHVLGGSEMLLLVYLTFCRPNDIDIFYCNLPWFIKFACKDTYTLEFMVTANSGFISMGTFFLLIISYLFTLHSLWKYLPPGLSKALSTLSVHITVLVLFFGPCIFIYMWPFLTVPVDKFLAILDFVIRPILNPDIYTLRNKDMKMAIKGLCS